MRTKLEKLLEENPGTITEAVINEALNYWYIMLPFVKTSKLSFLIPQTYDTCGSFSPLETKLLVAW